MLRYLVNNCWEQYFLACQQFLLSAFLAFSSVKLLINFEVFYVVRFES